MRLTNSDRLESSGRIPHSIHLYLDDALLEFVARPRNSAGEGCREVYKQPFVVGN